MRGSDRRIFHRPVKAKGSGMMIVFLSTGVCAAGVFLTHHLIFICVGVTIILSYLVNVIKSTYWSILGDAGVPLHMTGIATGVISFIGLTPDIFVAPVISRFITWEKIQAILRQVLI